jgi:hypothetical protein
LRFAFGGANIDDSFIFGSKCENLKILHLQMQHFFKPSRYNGIFSISHREFGFG